MTERRAADERAISDHLDFLRLRNVRPATSDARCKVLRALASVLNRPLLEAGRADLEAWQAGLTVSVSSRDTYTYHVRGFYQWAAKYDVIASDPSNRLVSPKMPQRMPRPIPEDALTLAIRCADDRMRAWLVLGAFAGLRAGEIARLCREHVQDHETPALINVVNGKGGKERIVPVGGRVCDTLRPHLRGRGPLWRNTAGRQITPNSLTQVVSTYMQSLGLPYTAHNLRHRYASQVYQLSGDLRMTGDLLGHASPASTALYTAWAPKAAVTAVEQLDMTLASGVPQPRSLSLAASR